MPTITTLGLAFRYQPGSEQGGSDRKLRVAFLALASANVFLLSGAICFLILYFTH